MADQPELEALHDGLDRPVEVFLGSAVVPTHGSVFYFPVFIRGPKGGRGHERAVPRGPVDLVQVDVSAVHALDGLAAGPYAYLLVVPVCLLRARRMLVADAAGVDLGEMEEALQEEVVVEAEPAAEAPAAETATEAGTPDA